MQVAFSFQEKVSHPKLPLEKNLDVPRKSQHDLKRCNPHQINPSLLWTGACRSNPHTARSIISMSVHVVPQLNGPGMTTIHFDMLITRPILGLRTLFWGRGQLCASLLSHLFLKQAMNIGTYAIISGQQPLELWSTMQEKFHSQHSTGTNQYRGGTRPFPALAKGLVPQITGAPGQDTDS